MDAELPPGVRCPCGSIAAPASDGILTSWDLGVSDQTAVWFWRLSSDSLDARDARGWFARTPAHSWSSHGADAWRYLSVVAKDDPLWERSLRDARDARG